MYVVAELPVLLMTVLTWLCQMTKRARRGNTYPSADGSCDGCAAPAGLVVGHGAYRRRAGVADHTVGIHIANLRVKLGAKSRFEAVMAATRLVS